MRRTRAVPLSLTLLAAVTLTGCVTSVRPLADDFSDEPPDEALSHTLDRLEDVYAFGDWKAIDWSEARQRLGDAMDAADTQAGQDQVFRALVELLPDGHVDLWNDDPSRDLCPEASGGLGVTFSDTDDAGVIVVTAAGNPGADISADIDPGDTLIAVNGVLVEDALEATPLRCYPIGLATWDRRRFARLHLLARAEVGAEVTLTLGCCFSAALSCLRPAASRRSAACRRTIAARASSNVSAQASRAASSPGEVHTAASAVSAVMSRLPGAGRAAPAPPP